MNKRDLKLKNWIIIVLSVSLVLFLMGFVSSLATQRNRDPLKDIMSDKFSFRLLTKGNIGLIYSCANQTPVLIYDTKSKKATLFRDPGTAPYKALDWLSEKNGILYVIAAGAPIAIGGSEFIKSLLSKRRRLDGLRWIRHAEPQRWLFVVGILIGPFVLGERLAHRLDFGCRTMVVDWFLSQKHWQRIAQNVFKAKLAQLTICMTDQVERVYRGVRTRRGPHHFFHDLDLFDRFQLFPMMQHALGSRENLSDQVIDELIVSGTPEKFENIPPSRFLLLKNAISECDRFAERSLTINELEKIRARIRNQFLKGTDDGSWPVPSRKYKRSCIEFLEMPIAKNEREFFLKQLESSSKPEDEICNIDDIHSKE